MDDDLWGLLSGGPGVAFLLVFLKTSKKASTNSVLYANQISPRNTRQAGLKASLSRVSWRKLSPSHFHVIASQKCCSFLPVPVGCRLFGKRLSCLILRSGRLWVKPLGKPHLWWFQIWLRLQYYSSLIALHCSMNLFNFWKRSRR